MHKLENYKIYSDDKYSKIEVGFQPKSFLAFESSKVKSEVNFFIISVFKGNFGPMKSPILAKIFAKNKDMFGRKEIPYLRAIK